VLMSAGGSGNLSIFTIALVCFILIYRDLLSDAWEVPLAKISVHFIEESSHFKFTNGELNVIRVP
jgi:hypothetical protein